MATYSESGNAAQRIALAILEELDRREPGFGRAVEAHLNSATKGDFASDAEFIDAQHAAGIVRDFIADCP